MPPSSPQRLYMDLPDVEPLTLVERALVLANTAHLGQTDRAGRPYIGHPHRVAQAVSKQGWDENHVAAAWLHDVVEDTHVTLEQVFIDFGPVVGAAVDALTHRPHESNVDYYSRVRANPIALVVKVLDVQDNAAPARLSLLDEVTRARLIAKYSRALDILQVAG